MFAGGYSCLYITWAFLFFFWFCFTNFKIIVKRIILELHSKRSPTDILGLISRSRPEKLISQEELVLVCNILAEALLGNDKATY